jgi:cutinase
MKFFQLSLLAYASAVSAFPATGLVTKSTTPTTTACTPQGSGGGSTENGIKNSNCCTDVTIVFARGTLESGNVGTTVGPPLFKALRDKIGASRVTVQGTAYAADILVSLIVNRNRLLN